MTQPIQLQRQLMLRIIVFIAPLTAVALLFGQWQTGLGLLLGGAGALTHLRLLVLDVHKITRYKSPEHAVKAARRGYARRYLLLFFILLVPAFNPWFNLAATIIGLLSIKFAIYVGEFLTYVESRREGGENDAIN
jgi:hypothetical protein